MPAIDGYAHAPIKRFELPRLGTFGLRMRVRCTSGRLTRELAAGASAGESRELALRARQVTDRGTRELIAASIGDLLGQADDGRPISGAQARIDLPKVRLTRVLLVELTERLRSPEPVAPRGMANVLLLLTDPAWPLYGVSDALALAEAIMELREMLDGLPESRLEL
jgi:hypothetical protein